MPPGLADALGTFIREAITSAKDVGGVGASRRVSFSTTATIVLGAPAELPATTGVEVAKAPASTVRMNAASQIPAEAAGRRAAGFAWRPRHGAAATLIAAVS